MLKSLPHRLLCPTCFSSDATLALHVFDDGVSGHVRDGLLVCTSCGAWCPIADYLLQLVPAELLDARETTVFIDRFGDRMSGLGLRAHQGNTDGRHDNRYDEQLKQRYHFDAYAEEGHPGFSDYTQSPFIKAAGNRYVRLWLKALGPPGQWVLDVGCGTGINSFPVAERHTLIGFDISRKTIKKVIHQALAQNAMERTTFLVADGGHLAFRPGAFDHVQTFGALHHLPDPQRAVQQIQQILVPGGSHFAVENNQTLFRGIFDLLMKIYPLWVEEAGAEPLISRAMVERWCQGLPVEITSQTSIFLPPHLFNLLGVNLARGAVDWSDRFFSLIPGIRAHGGQLVLQIKKLGQRPAEEHAAKFARHPH